MLCDVKNRAKSLEVIEGHSKLHRYVRGIKVSSVIHYRPKCVSILYRYWHIQCQTLAWPWNVGRGHSRSHTSSYSSSVV